MNVWVIIFANLVANNMETIEEVPEELRAQVEEVLKNK